MEKNIDFYYDRFQDCILKVKLNKDDKEAKKEAAAAFSDLFELIKMLLITKKERYYGYFLMSLNMITDYSMRYDAAVNLDENPFTMKINPLLISRYSIQEIVLTVCHEIEHLVLNHPAEGVRLNREKDPNKHKLLNLAMDASVNDRLIMEIDKYGFNIMKDPGDLITSDYLSEISQKTLQPLREFTYYFYNFPVRYVGTVPEDMEHDSHRWSSSDSEEDIEAAIRVFVESVARGISDEDMDKLPDHQRELLRKLLEPPKIRWQQLLRKYIGAVPDGFRKTRSRLNRRQPERYDVSGRVRTRTVKLVVAIDTSASMTFQMIEKIFVEIFAILKHVNHEVTIIECDDEIQNVYQAKSIGDVNPHVYGRGNTSFVPVIKYVNNHKEYRDAVLVYFTDGYGDFRIPKPRTYRNLWVISEGGGLTLDEPYGDVIEM